MAVDTEPALSIRGLYKVFNDDGDGLQLAIDGRSKDDIQEETGAVVGLRDINIQIGRGELFVVMGLSGCGKSTLVRCINRLIEPSVGQVWLDGREVTAMNQEDLREIRRRELAMVFQHFGLMPHRNVLDNVGLPLEVAGVDKQERRERANSALELVGLGEWTGSMPNQLSGGMKQRVGLARGLAMDTPVLLMDEPFSALDPVIRRELQDELLALQESVQKTIVFITHDLNEAVRVGDRIAIMRDGEVVQVGAPNDVVLNPADSFVREFTQDVRLHGMVTAASIMDTGVEALTAQVDDRYVVLEDAVLDELVPAGLSATQPLQVVNRAGVLVGVIPLERLARAMVSDEAAVAATTEGEPAG
ncbi:MAG: betaine/proline/choline family ABC transporter ATP-binding protein [Chloroflexi bacterium]|nr:betaine/proline/choline family ABC transporter ATP-binding protein [Chloroflexota bacterium]MCY3685632.1 betaine/proline/choline family ABC transporter ATP-binding protein [Chloroflexota bacterium]MDE2708534.1 betaine/proline/choline family ABC transporter ATP-binding protein [Chloroflexota bacterium]